MAPIRRESPRFTRFGTTDSTPDIQLGKVVADAPRGLRQLHVRNAVVARCSSRVRSCHLRPSPPVATLLSMTCRCSPRARSLLGAVVLCAFFFSEAPAQADDALPPPDPMLARPDTIPLTTGARVHISSQTYVRLERRARGTASWLVACEAPCDRDLPPGDSYRVVADGEDASEVDTFCLDAQPGAALTLDVKTNHDRPTTGSKIGGTALLVTGVAGLGIGIAGIAFGAAVSGATCTVPDSSQARSASEADAAAGACDHFYGGPGLGSIIIVGSAVIALVGGGLTAAGAALLLRSSGRTKTTQKPAFTREPTWVGAHAASPKPALVVPLGFSF